jgi:hypothetical protein
MTNDKNTKIPFVLITQEWLDAWLPVLKGTELKAYLRLAYHYNREKKISFPGQQTIAKAIGLKSYKPVMSALTKLEELGLMEALKKPPQKGMKGWPSNQYRMLHVDEDGYHRAERQQSSLKEAMEEDRAFLEFATDLLYKYNSFEEERDAVFEKYPWFKEIFYAKKLDECEHLNVGIFLSMYHWEAFTEKYSDLASFHEYFLDLLRDSFLKQRELERAVKEDILANWERVKEDYDYCGNYISDRYPKYFESLRNLEMTKGRHTEEYRAKASELLENHPDVVEISQYYNYGIFKELSEKHGVCSRAVEELFIQALREDKGEIGFKHDFENYLHEVVLPYENVFLTEEETRFAYLEADEITDDERRDLKGTLEKVKAARLKALDTLVKKTTYALASAYLNGQVRKNGGGEYTPEIRYYNKTEDGGYILESHGGHHPAKMDLGDLLSHITYEINRHTHYLMEYDDIYEHELATYRQTVQSEVIGKPNENALVSIPPVTLEQMRARFEEKKAELEANMRKDSKAS